MRKYFWQHLFCFSSSMQKRWKDSKNHKTSHTSVEYWHTLWLHTFQWLFFVFFPSFHAIRSSQLWHDDEDGNFFSEWKELMIFSCKFYCNSFQLTKVCISNIIYAELTRTDGSENLFSTEQKSTNSKNFHQKYLQRVETNAKTLNSLGNISDEWFILNMNF